MLMPVDSKTSWVCKLKLLSDFFCAQHFSCGGHPGSGVFPLLPFRAISSDYHDNREPRTYRSAEIKLYHTKTCARTEVEGVRQGSEAQVALHAGWPPSGALIRAEW